MIACVVETGNPKTVAINNHAPAASRLESIPRTNIEGFASKLLGDTMFSLIVVVTSAPAKYAPRNSKIAAITKACVRVRALLPTEVPIAFATSFAPIP